MARSESLDTWLLHSLIRRWLALLSIYSAQCLRDREQSKLCVVNSYWFRSTADKENRNIGVRDRCHICWFCLWRVNKSKLFSVSALSKEPFREHRILGNELVCRSRNASHQRGYAVEWNSAKWQVRLSNHVLFTSNQMEYMAILFQRIFVLNLHVDISSGFTFKVSGASALREQVSQCCNICMLSRQTDAASGGFHPEGATIISSWNNVKWHVNSKFSNIKSGKNK